MMNRYFLMLFCCAILWGQLAKAQEASLSFDHAEMSASSVQAKEIEIPTPAPLRFGINGARFEGKLSFGELFSLASDGDLSFKVEVELDVAFLDNDDDTLLQKHQVLEVTETNAAQLYYFEFDELGKSAKKIQFSGTWNSLELDYSDATKIAAYQSYIEDHIELEGKVIMDYRVDIRRSGGDPLSVIQTNINNYADDNTQRVVRLKWSNERGSTRYQFPNYQIQILRLYNTDPNPPFSEENISTDFRWEEAAVLETMDPYPNIDGQGRIYIDYTLAEGQGFYAWRVRPVGTFFPGGVTNSLNHGAWSMTSEPPVNIDLSRSNSHKNLFFFYDPDDQRNFNYKRVFTESNKTSEEINYANGLLQPRQSQTYIESNKNADGQDVNTTVVQQQILDHTGRPSLETLPVPVNGKLGSYKQDFVRTEGGEVYGAEHFDEEGNIYNPARVDDDPSQPYSYYSDNNPDVEIPSASGYPFSRTVFEDDGSGRVIETSGVGEVHRIGQNHTVKKVYTNPSDNELIRVFGEEALPADKVIKVETTDENGVTSVEYTAHDGNVIATALSYYDGGALLPLDNEEVTDFTAVHRVKGNEVEDATTFTSQKEVELLRPTIIDLDYVMPSPETAYNYGCLSQDGDCGLEFTVVVVDNESGDVIHESVPTVLPATGQDYQFSSKAKEGYELLQWRTDGGRTVFPSGPGETLPVGSYTFIKRLRVTANPDQQLETRLADLQVPLEAIAGVFYDWLSKVDLGSDLYRFAEHVERFNQLYNFTQDEVMGSQALYSLGAFDLRLVEGIEQLRETDDAGNPLISFEFLPANAIALGEIPDLLVINTSCCARIEIPISYTEAYVCPDPADITREYMDGQFSSHLDRALLTPYGLTVEEVAPGYTLEAIDRMMFHMMKDEYYYGPILEDETLMIPEAQYTCDQVWNCWISAVKSYKDLAANSGAFNMREGDLNDDSEEGGFTDDEDSEDNQDNAMDDAFDDIPGGWFIRFLMGGKSPSEKVESKESSGATEVFFEANVVSMFLDCSGYKFASLVSDIDTETGLQLANPEADRAWVLPGDDLDESLRVCAEGETRDFGNNCYDPLDDYDGVYYVNGDESVEYGYDNSFLAYPATKPQGAPESYPEGSYRIPYVKSPVFAFKYFEYNATDNIKAPRKVTVEKSKCFLDFTNILRDQPIVADDAVFCTGGCDGKNFTDWGSETVKVFHSMVARSTEAAVTLDRELEEFPVPDIQEEVDKMENMCHLSCDNKLLQVQNLLMRHFEAHCYAISDCPAEGGHTVTMSEIEEMAQEIVGACRTTCSAIFENSATYTDPTCPNGYPCQDTLITCYGFTSLNYEPEDLVPSELIPINDGGFGFIPMDHVVVQNFLPNCLQTEYDDLMISNIDVHIDLEDNPDCDTRPDDPEWLGGQTTTCDPEYDPGNPYSPAQELHITVNDGSTEPVITPGN